MKKPLHNAGLNEKPSRAMLIGVLSAEIVRFQDATNSVDEAAAAVLAVDRADLPCMTMLLFGGPASAEQLAAAAGMTRKTFLTTLERLELAGYARRIGSGKSARIELTEHARGWIEKIWGPLRDQGGELLGNYPTRELSVLATVLQGARELQEKHATKLRAWLEVPSSRASRIRLRGGLSPAALRRVQLFVEANLARPIHIADLAERAGLSEYHFARAFKTSVGTTPRAFVEQRRIERARQLIDESNHSLVEIAAQTGLGTQSRLTTAFRLATGFTPAAYRRARR
jgi:AraC family transcriptional regulator